MDCPVASSSPRTAFDRSKCSNSTWKPTRKPPKCVCDTVRQAGEHLLNPPSRASIQLSLSCIFLLYAVSVIDMAVLRRRDLTSRRKHIFLIRSAVKTLERYHHPAATLAEAICHDLLINLLHDEAMGMLSVSEDWICHPVDEQL
jgi:hypothetical protein